MCPSCGASLVEVTASFPPVSGGNEATEPIAASEGPVLVVHKGPEIGERFYLEGSILTIGRDPSSSIFLNDITVSRTHATVRRSASQVSISDSGSLNGTYVNGVSVDQAELHNGDAVQIGRFHMVFLAGGGE